jgi:hypothetical protein
MCYILFHVLNTPILDPTLLATIFQLSTKAFYTIQLYFKLLLLTIIHPLKIQPQPGKCAQIKRPNTYAQPSIFL